MSVRSINRHQPSYQTLNGTTYPDWLTNILHVIDIDNWFNDIQKKRVEFKIRDSACEKRHNVDFDVRAQSLNLILYLYVKSMLVLEEHSALIVRQTHTSYVNFSNK